MKKTTSSLLRLFLALLLFQSSAIVFAQTDTTDNWDNELWTGLRFAWGEGNIKYTGEYQTRFIQNYNQLDRWYLEGAVHFLASKHIEIIPDFRFNVKPNNNEYRFGLGVVYKANIKKVQFVNQLKGQMDKTFDVKATWALREVIYLNYMLNDIWIPYVGGGVFFRKSETFSGVQVIRAGVGTYYNFNPLHSLSINYFIGRRDLGSRITYSGIFLLQLTLKFSNDYVYVPARYINF